MMANLLCYVLCYLFLLQVFWKCVLSFCLIRKMCSFLSFFLKYSATELGQSTNQDQQESRVEAPTQNSPTSVFVNSEPMREEQVQNAMKFLSHPKVRGSTVIYRRSFLEKKGLTKEEIDEAFRRVPVSRLLNCFQLEHSFICKLPTFFWIYRTHRRVQPVLIKVNKFQSQIWV